jgi:hypothetical protein
MIMVISEYFENYFYSLKQLASHTFVKEQQLCDWIELCILPNAAYHLKNQVQSSSFFGITDFSEEKEYFARGYTKWIELIKPYSELSSAQAYSIFYQQYAKCVNDLSLKGLEFSSDYFEDLEDRIQDHWQLFLSGKYGVITANGFIHEIVALESVDYLAKNTELTEEQMAKCVRLLERCLSYPPSQLNCISQAHKLLKSLSNSL